MDASAAPVWVPETGAAEAESELVCVTDASALTVCVSEVEAEGESEMVCVASALVSGAEWVLGADCGVRAAAAAVKAAKAEAEMGADCGVAAVADGVSESELAWLLADMSGLAPVSPSSLPAEAEEDEDAA